MHTQGFLLKIIFRLKLKVKPGCLEAFNALKYCI